MKQKYQFFQLLTLSLIILGGLNRSALANFEPLEQYSVLTLNLSKIPDELSTLASRINASTASELPALFAETESMLETQPRGLHDEIWFMLGLIAEKNAQFKQAEMAYSESLRRRANNVSAIVRLGVVAKSKGNCPGAIEYFNEARWRITEVDPDLLTLLAECFLKLKKSAKAEKLLTEALSLKPGHQPILRLILETRLKRLEKASSSAEKSQAETEILTFLEQLIAGGNREAKTLHLFTTYTLKHSDPLIDAAKYQQLESMLVEKAEQQSFKNEEIAEDLLRTLMRQGKLDEAKSTLETAAKSLPGSAKIKDLQSQLAIEMGQGL